MPKQQFALEPGGPKRLVVEWKAAFNNAKVSVDGQILSEFPKRRDFEAGGQWTLADGRRLEVRLRSRLFPGPTVEVMIDGIPLSGSSADPMTRLKNSAGVVLFVGGLTLLLGLIAELAKVDFLLRIGFGWISAGIGLVFIALGFGVLKRSMAALIAAVSLYVLDIVLTLVAIAETKGPPTGIVIKVFLLIGMCQGFGALSDLKRATSPTHVANPPDGGL
ncbi:MAG TPA: hypothetical protein PLL78_14865 [Fimbriimonadaceae bacterium]|nr:hypothetical protein [Fimbriimonadaceae bacterium]HRJ97954.1 hypothetical protein [Fimbriimonadaceae bacterium]